MYTLFWHTCYKFFMLVPDSKTTEINGNLFLISVLCGFWFLRGLNEKQKNGECSQVRKKDKAPD